MMCGENKAHADGIRANQRGHLMAGVMVLLAIMLIFSTVIFQAWDEVRRRDAEAEMIFRAQELVRAMVRYRRDHGTTPPTLEDLMEPGSKGQFFLRQLYKDPLVKNGKWGLLYLGPTGELIDPNAEDVDTLGGGAGLGRDNARGGTGLTGRQPDAVGGGLGRDRGRGGVNPRRYDAEAKDSIAGGRQLAGLPVAGVKSLCTDKPFRVYKGQTEYAQWLFSVLDLDNPQVPGQKGSGRGRQRAGPDDQRRGRDAFDERRQRRDSLREDRRRDSRRGSRRDRR